MNVTDCQKQHLASICQSKHMDWLSFGLPQNLLTVSSLVLQSDGTSKKGLSYKTFDATNNEQQFFVLDMREVGAGDAQTQLDLLKEIVGDISSFNKEVI